MSAKRARELLQRSLKRNLIREISTLIKDLVQRGSQEVESILSKGGRQNVQHLKVKLTFKLEVFDGEEQIASETHEEKVEIQ